jgi:hypothetical protein
MQNFIRRCPRSGGLGLGSLQKRRRGVRLTMGKNKTKTAIYHPPKSGMPYLVVTVSPDGVTATAVGSKDEARMLASKKTLKVEVQDATNEKS